MCNARVNKPKLPYLPCFTMVATGTCAFGAHCCFMHDERCLLRPKHLRKQIEHEMINHLLQYRSSKKRAGLDANIVGNNNNGHSSDEETFVHPYQQPHHHDMDHHSMDSSSDSDNGEYCPEFRSAASSISFSRDSFFWPQMQYTPQQIAAMSKVPYGKSKNTYSYDPLPMNDFGKYLEEMSSWYYYLSTLETSGSNTVAATATASSTSPSTNAMFREPSFKWNVITHRPRLPCLEKLAFGQSL